MTKELHHWPLTSYIMYDVNDIMYDVNALEEPKQKKKSVSSAKTGFFNKVI